MLELGDESVEAHREVGRTAAGYGVDLVVAVGDALADRLALTAGAAGVPDIAMAGDDATAAAYLRSIIRPGDVVLVKASRGGRLRRTAQALTGQPVTGL
jgi:UDP-N-acetylmuramoyl-tripeptide--D-alanyl-D-alanine ligase